MMRVGDLIASGGFCLKVQSSFAHFRTQRAWIGLFTGLKNDFSDLGGDYRERNLKAVAKGLYAAKILNPESEIDCERMKRKMFRVKALQFMERIEKSQAVLAAGDTDSNMVLIIDESIIINRLTNQA